ncbi:MAG TPA: UDP-glucose--hexose-1-phosphate uridylyltransferase [Leuconostoc pseudomesenteroides]|uniref:Galactose-1-phosphate uridylyltransferase n=1 Tax=Leuconostoc falkenbergense TaxID=2766470 RepID=A0ABT7S1J6_9LACO|nr:UDP-glucose--hexose-1-phosphate uridylyltransferase [Leuconostoc falkenbergense]MDM7647451.1 UDP-glucose--hexose-1-phosphate uridylyltransferase [Leuconostoc falkenbergense]HCU42462.1 UDP-glucose--hexose-1-phosphate uridylyltransferase [Leuconostoc pseudomesenteroides]
MAEIDLFTAFAKKIIAESDYTTDDEIYLVNQIMGLVGETNHNTASRLVDDDSVTTLALLDQLTAVAEKNGTLALRQMNTDMLGAQLMNFIVPRPSQVRKMFWEHYQQSPRQATDYFFDLSQRSNYIKTREISQNISYPVDTQYGTLQITINLSKPEKDPKAIAAALKNKNQQQSQYPVSQLAKENEGYWGRLDYAARTNHRVIPITLGHEKWYFQYSPYAYFNEHAIVLSEHLRPMHVDRENLSRLLEFVSKFPDYFIGSNADLPIVGGSILSHDHFQAGRYELPMAKAVMKEKITIAGCDLHEAGILNWPMTTIRLIDDDREKLLNAADRIMMAWQNYDDASLSIRAYGDDGERHHTVTPIVRFRSGLFEVDLVLRDNNTSDTFPDGIFHPHPDVQHIKKENIGLIEVMGLAILPPRLKTELAEVAQYLLGNDNNIAEKHQAWADTLKQSEVINANNVTHIVQQSVGQIFSRVLEDAGVFKNDQSGQDGLEKFIKQIEVGE